MAVTNQEHVGKALGYAGLARSWPEITHFARIIDKAAPVQAEMFAP